MSMISVQCDRLREMADSMRNAGRMSDASELSYAADTIETLRDMAQEHSWESRELFDANCALAKRNEELNRENAELRELVRDLLLLPSVQAFDCYGCKYDEYGDCNHRSKCRLTARASELGIEVDG